MTEPSSSYGELTMCPQATSSNSPIFDSFKAQVARYSVGFVRAVGGKLILHGSGTFASIGNTFGILTAAHVIDQLPDEGEMGLLRFFDDNMPQRTAINMEHTDRLQIEPNNTSADGPDIGFLKLAALDVSNLQARSNFHNLERRITTYKNPPESGQLALEAIVGTIDELTTTNVAAASIQSLYQARVELVDFVAREVHTKNSRTFDLLRYRPQVPGGYVPPRSYEGMSGGGLWRAYCSKNSSNEDVIDDLLIWGVAFHQSLPDQTGRVITCHGPTSVYEMLIEAVRIRWP